MKSKPIKATRKDVFPIRIWTNYEVDTSLLLVSRRFLAELLNAVSPKLHIAAILHPPYQLAHVCISFMYSSVFFCISTLELHIPEKYKVRQMLTLSWLSKEELVSSEIRDAVYVVSNSRLRRMVVTVDSNGPWRPNRVEECLRRNLSITKLVTINSKDRWNRLLCNEISFNSQSRQRDFEACIVLRSPA